MALFRFEDLDVWRKAVEIGHLLCDIADRLEERRRYKFAEQLRTAALSISNNIAEGSGSSSNREFARFVNIAKRSAFENANMIIFLAERTLVTPEERDSLLPEIARVARMLESLRKSLLQ